MSENEVEIATLSGVAKSMKRLSESRVESGVGHGVETA